MALSSVRTIRYDARRSHEVKSAAGGLAFGLFGPVGPITGEALGQVLLGLAGYLWLRLPAGGDTAASGTRNADPTSIRRGAMPS